MARRFVLLSAALLLCLAAPKGVEAQAGTSQTVCLPTIDLCGTFNGWSWSPASSPQFTTNFSFFGSGLPGFTPVVFLFTWEQTLSNGGSPYTEGFGSFATPFAAGGGTTFENSGEDGFNPPGTGSGAFGTTSFWTFPVGVSPSDVNASTDLRLFKIGFSDDSNPDPFQQLRIEECGVTDPNPDSDDPGGTVYMDGGLSLDVLLAGFALFQNPCRSLGTEVIPEPATIILLATGLLAVGGAAARRRKDEELEA